MAKVSAGSGKWEAPTLAEWLKVTEKTQQARLRSGFRIGSWRYGPRSKHLVHPKIDVPVLDFTSSADVLYWVARVSGTPLSAKDVGDFVRIVDELLGLHHFCGEGRKDGPVDVARLLKPTESPRKPKKRT